MKKALVAGILGIALNIATSHAQGYIIMQNYDLVNGVTPVFAGITYGSSAAANAGKFVGAANGFKADLMFSLDSGTTYSLAAGSQTALYTGSHDGGTPTTDGAGTFFGPTVTIPGYTSGAVKFIVEAYNGSSYAASVSGGLYNGQSSAFTMNSLQTNPGLPADDLLQLGAGTTSTGLQGFVVNVPEPTVFALAGLGAAGLMAFRRKKA